MKKSSKIAHVLHRYWLVGSVAIAFFVRAISLNQSLWLDESINVLAARDKGIIDLVTNYSMGDFHPPLWHILLRIWILLVGDGESAVRMLSVLLGVGTVYGTYMIAKELFKDKSLTYKDFVIPVAAIPTLLLAFSGLHVYYSQEARMYSLAAFGITGAIYFLLRYKVQASYKNAAGFIVLLWIGIMADYVPWLLLPGLFLLSPKLTTFGFGLTFPWWPYFYKQLQVGLNTASEFPLWGQVVGGLSLKNILLIPVKFLVGRVSIDNNLVFAVVLLIPLLFSAVAVGLVIKNWLTKKKFKVSTLFVWLFVPLVIGVVLAAKISLLSYFRFLFVLPAMYLLITLGLLKLKRDLVRNVGLVVIFLVTIISTTAYLFLPRFHRENWRGAVQWIEASATENSFVLIPNLAQSAPYLYYAETVPIYDQLPDQEPPQTVFLVRYVQEIFDPQDVLRSKLESMGYHMVGSQNFNGVVVWQYFRDTRIFALNK